MKCICLWDYYSKCALSSGEVLFSTCFIHMVLETSSAFALLTDPAKRSFCAALCFKKALLTHNECECVREERLKAHHITIHTRGRSANTAGPLRTLMRAVNHFRRTTPDPRPLFSIRSCVLRLGSVWTHCRSTDGFTYCNDLSIVAVGNVGQSSFWFIYFCFHKFLILE